ncbi:MAG TPA: nucleoside phosphorylase [Candidatus Dormibacteraeota bacterium]|nr:nucleoside phosphorylase [Candidatus Dormibacteraeota bacterium]
MPDAAGRRYHLRCGPGDVGGYVLLPGDPGRVPLLAGRLDGARPVAANREFTTWTGALGGVPVSVTSTGIGGPSAAIAVEELCDLGAHTLLRVGTCGAMQPFLRIGDLVIPQAAVRDEGTSHQYVPGGWPAVAHLEVVDALRAAARASGAGWHAGVVQSKDGFYSEMEPERMPAAAALLAHREACTRIGVLASEMECAAVFTVAATRRVRAGAVLAVVNVTPAHDAMPSPDDLPIDRLLDVAVAAVRALVEADAAAAGA